ncbi:MAG TPA: SDR family NAD(P)-dependent oxidoreductase, partial [Chondromyces sp.]|nr:SDR family NAD(P)-dependent oxidoreductase [Chondromyces sp.]
MDLHLEGRNILITGGARGIGREIARAAANEGAHIALHYHHSEKEAYETAKLIEGYGVNVVLV